MGSTLSSTSNPQQNRSSTASQRVLDIPETPETYIPLENFSFWGSMVTLSAVPVVDIYI
jgi:hypothetical protein